MHLTWDTNCSWIFDSWTSESAGGLIIGLIITFIFTTATVAYPFYKSKFLNKNKLQRTISFGISYLLKIIVMFIVMSMNAWVCIAVILGMTTGQILFQKVTMGQVKQHILQS